MSGNTQLYLTFETSSASPGEASARLQSVLAAVPVASALLRPSAGTILDAQTTAPLVTMLQTCGITALIADDAALARTLKADGVHLSWSKDIVTRYGEARAHLGATAIIGADAGRSRHDAMLLGEAAADYVAFGIPPHVGDRETAEQRQLDLIAWWSEIFQPPCVAFDVTSASHAQALAAASADFIAVTVSPLTPTADATRTLAAYAEAITLSREPV